MMAGAIGAINLHHRKYRNGDFLMNCEDGFLQIDLVHLDEKAKNVTHLFEKMALRVAHETGLYDARLFRRLIDQERRGTSGVGGGVAIPHVRLPRLERSFIFLTRLSRPLDFNAVDNRSVDIVCLLLSPESEMALHLRRLSRLSRLLRDDILLRKIRGIHDPDMLRALFRQFQDIDKIAA